MKEFARYLAVPMLLIFTLTLVMPAGYSTPVAPTLGTLEIPANLGKIESQFEANSKFKIILIQDAHANPDAQRSIRKLIDYFRQKQNVQLVGVEGATTKLDPSLLKTFPNSEEVRKLIESLESKGEISGVVSSAVLNPEQIDYVGVDDEVLYQQALDSYAATQKKTTVFEKQIAELESELEGVKRKLFTPKLFELDQKWNRFQTNPEGEIETFLRFCFAQQKPGEQYKTLYSLHQDFERSGNKEHSYREISSVENQISKTIISKPDRMKFSEKQQAFKTGRLDLSGYAFFLLELARQNQVSGINLSFLEHHAELESLRVKAQNSDFGKELKDYFEVLKKPFLNSIPVQITDDLSERLNLLKKLERLELTSLDWELFNQEKLRFQRSAFLSFLKSQNDVARSEQNLTIRMAASNSGEFDWKPSIDFYESNKTRDQKLVENLIQEMNQRKLLRGILVSGGFHRNGIERWLQSRNISYISICPYIGSLGTEASYQMLMEGKVSWTTKENIQDPYSEFQGFAIRKLFHAINPGTRRDYLRLWKNEIERTSNWKTDHDNNLRLLYQNYWQILSQKDQSKLESGFQKRLKQLNLDEQTLKQATLPLALSSTIPALGIQILQPNYQPLIENRSELRINPVKYLFRLASAKKEQGFIVSDEAINLIKEIIKFEPDAPRNDLKYVRNIFKVVFSPETSGELIAALKEFKNTPGIIRFFQKGNKLAQVNALINLYELMKELNEEDESYRLLGIEVLIKKKTNKGEIVNDFDAVLLKNDQVVIGVEIKQAQVAGRDYTGALHRSNRQGVRYTKFFNNPRQFSYGYPLVDENLPLPSELMLVAAGPFSFQGKEFFPSGRFIAKKSITYEAVKHKFPINGRLNIFCIKGFLDVDRPNPYAATKFENPAPIKPINSYVTNWVKSLGHLSANTVTQIFNELFTSQKEGIRPKKVNDVIMKVKKRYDKKQWTSLTIDGLNEFIAEVHSQMSLRSETRADKQKANWIGFEQYPLKDAQGQILYSNRSEMRGNLDDYDGFSLGRSEVRNCAVQELVGARAENNSKVGSDYFLKNPLNVSVLWKRMQELVTGSADLLKIRGVFVLDADLIPNNREGQEMLINSLPEGRVLIADSKLNQSVSRDNLVNDFLELLKKSGKSVQKVEKNGINIQTRSVADKFNDDIGVILSPNDILGDKNPERFEAFKIDQAVLSLLGPAALSEILTRIALAPAKIREKYLSALGLAREQDGSIFVGVRFMEALETILKAQKNISASA